MFFCEKPFHKLKNGFFEAGAVLHGSVRIELTGVTAALLAGPMAELNDQVIDWLDWNASVHTNHRSPVGLDTSAELTD